MRDVVAELQTKISDLGIEYPISITIYNVETGDEVLHWDFDTGGSDATSANTD